MAVDDLAVDLAVDRVSALLREPGAETIEHPGGTLYAHLGRVHDRLAGHGATRTDRCDPEGPVRP